jgi:FAD/FMN-containing dehydrogenase
MAPPPIVVPDEQFATAEQIFRPVDAALVPELAEMLAYLSEHDPDVLAAVADVDRSLIWAAMEMGPLDYLDEGARLIEDLDNFRERADAQNAA